MISYFRDDTVYKQLIANLNGSASKIIYDATRETLTFKQGIALVMNDFVMLNGGTPPVMHIDLPPTGDTKFSGVDATRMATRMKKAGINFTGSSDLPGMSPTP